MNIHPVVDAAEQTRPGLPSVRELFCRQLLQHAHIHHEPQLETIIARNRAARVANPTAALPSVGIIGAGMAGLYAAMLLEDLGLEYHILEANNERIGGRIYTYRYPELVEENVPYPYVELGAMRFPKISTMDRLLGEQSWSLFNKLNNAGHTVLTIPYHLSDPNNIRYYNGRRIFASDSLANDPLYFSDTKNGGLGTAVPDKYCYTPYTEFLYPEYNKFADEMMEDFNTGFNNLLDADNNSTRVYLYKRLFEQSAINFFETMETGTGLYDMAFSETIMDYFDFSGSEWLAIEGGTDVMVNQMVKMLKANSIEQGKFVTKITQKVNDAGNEIDGLNVQVYGEAQPRQYGHVISTGTLASLRKMNLKDLNLSHNKKLAIRACNYDHSVKISLSFNKRWWEDSTFMKGKPIKGGTTSTDLPVRNIVYPSYGTETEGAAGILIVSYTWAQDASRIGSLVGDVDGEKQLIALCMENLAEVHNVDVKVLKEMLIGFKCWDWYSDDYSMGAFALYSPSQFTQLFPALTKPSPNGRFHLAGEATSVHHAWVIGSLNSAYRAVDHVLMVEGLDDLRAKLRENWGTIDECEDPYYSYADVEVGGFKDPKQKETAPSKKLKVAHSTKDAIPKLIQAALLKKPRIPTTAACIGGLSK